MSGQLALVVGNPKPRSRTMDVASALADVLAEHLPWASGPDRRVVDLADLGPELLHWPSPRVDDVVAQVCDADLLIVASPVYKATYTGLLKCFFDRLTTTALSGVAAVPLMVGGSSTHALAVELHLRPLLVEVGAAVPTRGFFVTEQEVPHVQQPIDLWLTAALPTLGQWSPAARRDGGR